MAACGGRPYQDELAELDDVLSSAFAEDMRVDLDEIEDQNVRDLRERALELLDAAHVNFDFADDAWRGRKDDQATEFSRVGLIYYHAAENYSRSAEARVRLSTANVRHQEQRERRNTFNDVLRSEEELVALLETVQQLFERNEELRRELATIEEQYQSESRAVYAIQEARILQREAEGMRADEYADDEYSEANATLARAVTHHDEGDYEEAYDVALRALEAYRGAIEAARPEYMRREDSLMRDGENQAIFEDAQRVFGPELAFIDARGIVIVVPNLFEQGGSEPKQNKVYLLDEVLNLVREFDDRSVLIEGHTQDRGSGQTNMALSQTRADEVQDYFLSRSVSGRRMSTAGFGEDAPRFDNRQSAGRHDNDRVEIVFLFD